jgi:hypothetical protein
LVSCSALAIIAFLPSASRGQAIGNNLWNLRENTQYFFDNNTAWVRPWETTVDDGWGEFRGGEDYNFAWGTSSTTGNPLDGSLSLGRGVDHQFDAWAYLYVPTPTTISLEGDGDCVPCWFLNYAFDSPQQFPLGVPASISLSAGWNRLDITGYSQSDGFLFTTDALASQVEVMNTSIMSVPEPSTLALLTCGVLGSLLIGGKMLAKKLLPLIAPLALTTTARAAKHCSAVR